MLFKMSITVGDKEVREVIYSQQFHVKYGEKFTLSFQDDENSECVLIRFIQEIYKPFINVAPFDFDKDKSLPYVDFDEKRSQDYDCLCYILHNFNQTSITTNAIPFYTANPSGFYSFQLSAMSISDELNNPETYWLYTVTIYKENAHV